MISNLTTNTTLHSFSFPCVSECRCLLVGIFVILGSTYTGHYEPVQQVSDVLDKYQEETGIDIPIHVDGASGAMFCPFTTPSVKFGFEIPRVKSINTYPPKPPSPRSISIQPFQVSFKTPQYIESQHKFSKDLLLLSVWLLSDSRLDGVDDRSGHKYGLTYAGLGWIIFRNEEQLPKHLKFELHYLGGIYPFLSSFVLMPW